MDDTKRSEQHYTHMYDDLSKGLKNYRLHTHDVNPNHIRDGYYPCCIEGVSSCRVKDTWFLSLVEHLSIVGQGTDFNGNKIPDVDCLGKTFVIDDGCDDRINYRLFDHLVCIAMYEPNEDRYLNIRHIAADVIMPGPTVSRDAKWRISGIKTAFYVRIATIEQPDTYKTVYEYVKHDDAKALELEELNRS